MSSQIYSVVLIHHDRNKAPLYFHTDWYGVGYWAYDVGPLLAQDVAEAVAVNPALGELTAPGYDLDNIRVEIRKQVPLCVAQKNVGDFEALRAADEREWMEAVIKSVFASSAS